MASDLVVLPFSCLPLCLGQKTWDPLCYHYFLDDTMLPACHGCDASEPPQPANPFDRIKLVENHMKRGVGTLDLILWSCQGDIRRVRGNEYIILGAGINSGLWSATASQSVHTFGLRAPNHPLDSLGAVLENPDSETPKRNWVLWGRKLDLTKPTASTLPKRGLKVKVFTGPKA